jgi:hypothetical protein
MRARYWTDKRPSVNVFDTETFHGDLLILCDPKECLEVGPGTRFGHILNFLWRRGRRENFFWNVGYDLGAILKRYIQQLTPRQRRELRARHRVFHGRLVLTFAGDKGFRIRSRDGHREKRYWDLAPFYSEEISTRSLDDVAREKLGEGKGADVDRQRLGSERGYYQAHRERVIEYCKRDASLTCRLAELRIGEIAQALGFYPTRFSSKASLSKAFLDRNFSDVLDCPLPRVVEGAFRKAYRGGIFHTRILGRVPNVTELDISSAYPSVIAELPDLRALTPRVSNEFHQDALLGGYLIETRYEGDLPLAQGRNRRIVYPKSRGPRPYWATLPELRYLRDLGRSFHVRLAYEYFGPYRQAFPGFEMLYARRQKLRRDQKEDLAFLLKVTMAACYGALAESKFGETRFTNWVYAATITGATRARIWSLCAHLGWERVVSINTDSVRFIGASPWYEAHRDEITKPGFGAWEEKYRGATVTHYQSGVALIEEPGKKPHLRRRGFKNLTPELLWKAKGHRLEVGRTRAIKLGEALARDRVDDLGDFQEEERVLELQSNLHALDFPMEKLTFEYLNRLPLEGVNPDFDEVARPRRNEEHFTHKTGLGLRGPGKRDEASRRTAGNRFRPPRGPKHEGIR